MIGRARFAALVAVVAALGALYVTGARALEGDAEPVTDLTGTSTTGTSTTVDTGTVDTATAEHQDGGHEDGGHEDGGHQGDGNGFSVTVNGRPAHGDGSPHLEGCSLSIAVSGMGEGTHEVTVSVLPVEGSETPYRSERSTSEGDAWSATWDMTDPLADVEPQGNGYHIRVVVTVDGSELRSKAFWLGCGSEGGGNPIHLTFTARWTTLDGTISDRAPMGSGAFLIQGTTKMGDATCAYPAVDASLVCAYSNRGDHAAETDWLVLPGGEKHTYSVSVTGVPMGWQLEPDAEGTSLGRDRCPSGEHGAMTRPVCVHVVALTQRAPVTTTPATDVQGPTITPAAAPPPSTVISGPSISGTPAISSLPATAGEARPTVLLGLLLVAVGFAVLHLSTRLVVLSPPGLPSLPARELPISPPRSNQTQPAPPVSPTAKTTADHERPGLTDDELVGLARLLLSTPPPDGFEHDRR